jgi:gliding motility-associated-like protein
MKRFFALAILAIITRAAFSQCPFPVNMSSTGNCLGATLSINTGSSISQIIWYNGSTPVDTISSGTYTSKLIAGGNGEGAAANQLALPNGIWLDAAGNLYVSDAGNYRVQKFNAGSATGVTIAGDHGPGTGANQLNFPRGLYVDPAGNLYVVDDNNERVQKWPPGASSGVTVAGGNGQGAAANQFNLPYGLFVDAAGNLYIADQDNERVQEWAPGATTGITVAGGNGRGNAPNQFDGAISVYVDAGGNVYVADENNNRVQKWAPGATSGVTVAGGNGPGSAANQLFGANAVYVDANGNVYVADFNNGRVQKWPPGATTGTTVAGGNLLNTTGVPFTEPSALYIDASGNVYVSLAAGSGSVQEWTPAYSPASTTYTPLTTGLYSAVVTDINNCTATTNTIEIDSLPVIPSGQTFYISPGQNQVIDPQVSGDVVSYVWSPAIGLSDATIQNPVANPSKTTDYTLTVFSKEGCQATSNIIVKVAAKISLPNAFTPNGDGKNDIFYILGGLEGMIVEDFSIFDRWGQRIFQINNVLPGDPAFGWNGTYKGSPEPAGAYVYMVTIKSGDHTTQIYKGTVVLIR